MEVLHSQLATLQRHLAWVSTEPLDWKLYVQAFSWSVYLFESYLTFVYPSLRLVLLLTQLM